ncbi:MAG: hypothetical protein E6K72_02160 [Candidatus Eisenbacteria bacterium]|uniref:Uncharacterized protein n=1 Tax=Eiseniibacteriota bacterium TaxID=2212470 RepID=A0A538T5D9_UNCEI|nr:MAG: hypothetical protein E6K72_02160 [Candidatus Eisenbacteria bacterium]
MGEQLRAVNDRDPMRARRREVRHLLLDRGRDHQGCAVVGQPRSVLGMDRDPEPFEGCTLIGPLAAVEGAIAPAHAPAP